MEVAMFDAGQTPGSGCADSDNGGGGSPEKRQDTIKGIESEGVNFVRDAARKEGMKIGAWISARMKEAAFRSLASPPVSMPTLPPSRNGLEDRPYSDAGPSFHDLKAFCDRLERIEAELHEISRSQRAIMVRM